jgi:hypothetical protein
MPTNSSRQDATVDPATEWPPGLLRVVQQNLADLTPWHIMAPDLVQRRLPGLRQRYRTKYIPFAYRQDNDDLAVIVAGAPERIVIVHDFAAEGREVVAEYASFWDWFRVAVEDMVAFE